MSVVGKVEANFEICNKCCLIFMPCKNTKKCINCVRYFCTVNNCALSDVCPACNKQQLIRIVDRPLLPNDMIWLNNYVDFEVDCSSLKKSELQKMMQARLGDPFVRSVYTNMFPNEQGSLEEQSRQFYNDNKRVSYNYAWGGAANGNKNVYNHAFEQPVNQHATVDKNSDMTAAQLKTIMRDFEEQRGMLKKFEVLQQEMKAELCKKDELKAMLTMFEDQKEVIRKIEVGQEKLKKDIEKKFEAKALVSGFEEQKQMLRKMETEQEKTKKEIEKKQRDACLNLERKFDKMQNKMDNFLTDVRKMLNDKVVKDMKMQIAKLEEQQRPNSNEQIKCLVKNVSEKKEKSPVQNRPNASKPPKQETLETAMLLNGILQVIFFATICCHTVYLFYVKAMEYFTPSNELIESLASDDNNSRRFISTLGDIFLDMYLVAVTYEGVCSIFYKEARFVEVYCPRVVGVCERHAEQFGGILHKGLRYLYICMFFYDTVCLLLPSILAFLVTLFVLFFLFVSYGY